MTIIFIGIDPGAGGGLAAVSPQWTMPKLLGMPETEMEILEWVVEVSTRSPTICNMGDVSHKAFAVIEKVHAMPGNGVSGMFKFGMSYGALRMALTAAGFIEGETYIAVEPKEWQKRVGVYTPPEKRVRGVKRPKLSHSEKHKIRVAHKQRLKARAEELFPGVRVTLKTSDALLLAYYCQQIYT